MRLLPILMALACAALAQEPVAGTPYTRYRTIDRFHRNITFYLDGDQTTPLPIVLSILGSGAYSNFIQRGDRTLDAHRTTREVFAGKAHILIVEKPGVEFLEQHPNRGTAVDGSAEFRREHTLERWAEAVSASLQAAWAMPLADHRRCLLVGHSEGAIVAARVAAQNPFVTHVASLAGAGPTQLYDLLESARAQPDPDQAVAQLLAKVAGIENDPDNPDKFFLGHPYRRWSSFWNSSTLEELLHSKARIFIAQGTADQNVSVTGFDMLFATLLSKGRDVTSRRIAGADHGFGFEGQPGRDGWREIWEGVRDWFLDR